jgi:hypothetical protein
MDFAPKRGNTSALQHTALPQRSVDCDRFALIRVSKKIAIQLHEPIAIRETFQ